MIRVTMLIISLLLFATAAQSDDMPRTVSVDGKGFVAMQPDMARLNLAVEERDPSLDAAQDAVAATTADVMALLDRLDIEDRHVDTTGATVQPDYRWNRETEQQELVGYIVRRRIDVEVRDLEVLGKLIDGAVRAGVNQVSPPVLDSSKRRDLYRAALAKAVQDARKNAEALAGSLDVDIGDVLQISAASRMPMPLPIARAGVAQMEMALAETGASMVAFQAGEMRLEATVMAVFELEN